MKTTKYIISLLFALAIASGLANAYFYSVGHTCNDDICIEKDEIEWFVNLTNDGNHYLEFVGVDFIDVLNQKEFASYRLPFDPYLDKRDVVVLRPNGMINISFKTKLPKANFKQALVYKPCFIITITDSYTIARDNVYETKKCFEDNESIELIQCTDNSYCREDESCVDRDCIGLKCGSCQYFKNHECLNYQCCGNEQCALNEACTNNTCMKIDCNYDEYMDNRTCKPLNCRPDEYIENEKCKKLMCDFDDYIVNRTCRKLECSEDEFIFNNTCRDLDCSQKEFAGMHSCNPLECVWNETFFNHSCMPLDCRFFQKIEDNNCANNYPVILKLLMELTAVAIIIMFLTMDFKKYRQKHKKEETEKDKTEENEEKQ
ncbi:MAG TPA: hypothetical protein VJI97_00495 [Candidatus Nanoarchaeia archaeon]|nr:hypothetical protein [Candidatus Nanoarchaeia archaeon]